MRVCGHPTVKIRTAVPSNTPKKLKMARAHAMMNRLYEVVDDCKARPHGVSQRDVVIAIREAWKQDSILRSHPPTEGEVSLAAQRVWREVRP